MAGFFRGLVFPSSTAGGTVRINPAYFPTPQGVGLFKRICNAFSILAILAGLTIASANAAPATAPVPIPKLNPVIQAPAPRGMRQGPVMIRPGWIFCDDLSGLVWGLHNQSKPFAKGCGVSRVPVRSVVQYHGFVRIGGWKYHIGTAAVVLTTGVKLQWVPLGREQDDGI